MQKILKSTSAADFREALVKLQSFMGYLITQGIPPQSALKLHDILLEEMLKDFREMLTEEILAAQRQANEAIRGATK